MTQDLRNKFGIFYLHLDHHASQIFTLQSLMKDEFCFGTRSLHHLQFEVSRGFEKCCLKFSEGQGIPEIRTPCSRK
jgi:hypothetical protein